jgi:diguanylate cyclase (GGDEF)-like protein/PAS domain S-box-containing protein
MAKNDRQLLRILGLQVGGGVMKMPKFISTKLTNKILAMCIITIILPLTMMLGYLYAIEKESVINAKLSALETIYKVKLNEIQLLTDSEKESLETIAALPYLRINFENISKKEFANTKELDKYFVELVNKRKFYDVFFIDLDGNIKYTVKKENDLGTNLLTGKYNNSGLAESFRNSKLLVQSSIVPIEFYEPSNKPAGFVTTPVLSGGKLVGILGAQIDEDDFFDTIKSALALGRTGEIVAGILKPDGKIVAATPLKYAPKAFEQQLVLNQKQHATGMTKAARGGKGIGEVLDYRGVSCFAVYGYVPSLRWGLVAKIDKQEALDEVNGRLSFFLFTISLILLALIVSVIFIARFITNPIVKLTDKTNSIIGGDLSVSLVVDRDDELGTLSSSFNAMTEEIKIQIHALSEQARLLEEQSHEIEENNEALEDTVRQRTFELSESKQKLERYVGVIDEHVISSTTDTKGIIIGVSAAFCKISGYSKAELMGKSHNIVRHPDMPTSLYEQMWDELQSDKAWSGEIKNMKKDGGSYWVRINIEPLIDSNGTKIGYAAVREDITDKKIIEKLSITDELTKLYNRRYFNQIFAQKVSGSSHDVGFAFLMLDVDNFKKYNDTYGHQKGDTALTFIGEALSAFVNADEYGFRLGGEEFGAIIKCKNADEAMERAEKLRIAIQHAKIPHEQNESKVLTVSIGTKFIDFSQTDSPVVMDTIYKECDEALYAAKESGRNRVVLA